MRYYFGKQILALALFTGLCFSATAAEHTVPHKEHCQGTLEEVAATTLFFAGQGNATHFGKYLVTGSNDFDDKGNVLDGEFTSTVADGSTISGIYTGLADGKIRFDVKVNWLVGTGRLEGVTGEADVVAILDALAEGAAFEYVSEGTLTFP